MTQKIVVGCLFFISSICYNVYAQDTYLFNIPEGYIILSQENVDFNKDKLMDRMIFMEKQNKQDGDSTLVVFYVRNKNGSLEHFKTFGNLCPLYFQSYQYNYEIQDTSLTTVFQNYVGLNPNNQILVKDKKINIIKKPNAITYCYEFVFDVKKNNWFLSSRKTISPTFQSPTEKYFFNDPKAIPLEKYSFLLDIKE